MAVWKSIFLHEFSDGDPTNFNAIPGDLAIVPDGVVVKDTPEPDDLGFDTFGNRSLTYSFESPLEDVIGIDLSIDLLIPPQNAQFMQIVSVGDGRVKLSLNQGGFVGQQAIATLEVDGESLQFDYPFTAGQTGRLRVRWHTRGQAQVWREGSLMAYEPGFAAGRSFGLGGLTIGGLGFGSFRARRIYLKALRRHDAQNEINRHIEIASLEPSESRCVGVMRNLQSEMLSRSRVFMAGAISNLTTSWREGQPGGPFSSEAVAANAAVVEAAQAFGAFLDTGETAAANAFVERIGDFMDLLAEADPSGFTALLDDLQVRADSLEPACREELESLYNANAEELAPLVQLLHRAWDRIQNTTR